MDFIPAYRAMTAEDVLAALRESLRQQVEYDPEATQTELTFDSTIAAWRDACDLVAWRPLGRALNAIFETHFTDGEWKPVLTPPKRRTLRDVCALLASQARAPMVESKCLLGASCRAAGTFLLVRDALRRDGANVDDLRPSSPTAPWLRKHLGALLILAEKIAPRKLPPVRVVNRGYDRGITWLLIGWFGILLACGLSCLSPFFLLIGLPIATMLALGGYLRVGWTAGKPDVVQFGEIATFRDLCCALAGESSRSGRRPMKNKGGFE